MLILSRDSSHHGDPWFTYCNSYSVTPNWYEYSVTLLSSKGMRDHPSVSWETMSPASSNEIYEKRVNVILINFIWNSYLKRVPKASAAKPHFVIIRHILPGNRTETRTQYYEDFYFIFRQNRDAIWLRSCITSSYRSQGRRFEEREEKSESFTF